MGAIWQQAILQEKFLHFPGMAEKPNKIQRRAEGGKQQTVAVVAQSVAAAYSIPFLELDT
jgi:hypothetical protein